MVNGDEEGGEVVEETRRSVGPDPISSGAQRAIDEGEDLPGGGDEGISEEDVPEDSREGDVIISGGTAGARREEKVVTEGGGVREPTEEEQEEIREDLEKQGEQAEEQREALRDISRIQASRIEEGRVRELTGEEEEILQARRARFEQAEELTESRRVEESLRAARGDVSRNLETVRGAESGTEFFFSPEAVEGTRFEDRPRRTRDGEEVVVLDPSEAESFLRRRRTGIESALEGEEEFQRQAGIEVRRLEAVESGIARGDISEFVTAEERSEREAFRQSVQDIVGDAGIVTGPVSVEEQRRTTDADEIIAQLGPVERGVAAAQVGFTSTLPILASTIPGGRTPEEVTEREFLQVVRGEETPVGGAVEALQENPLGIVGSTAAAGGAIGAGGRAAGVALQGTRLSSLASPTVARGLLGAGAVGATAVTSAEVGSELGRGDVESAAETTAQFGFGAAGFTSGLRAGSQAAGRFFAPRIQQVSAARPTTVEQFEVPGGRTGRSRGVFEITSRQRDIQLGRLRQDRSPLVDRQVTEFGFLDIGASRTASLTTGGSVTRGTGTFERFGRLREGEEGVSILEGERPVRFEFTTGTGERLPTERVAEAVGRTSAFGIEGARPEIPVIGARQTRTRISIEEGGVEEFSGIQFTQDRLQLAEGPVAEVFRGGTVGETGGTPTGTPVIGRVIRPDRFPEFRFTQTFENFRGFDASLTRDIDTPVGSLSLTVRAESQAVPEFGTLARNLAQVRAQPPAGGGGTGLVPASFTLAEQGTETTDEEVAGELTETSTRTETRLTGTGGEGQTGVTVERAAGRFTTPAPSRLTGQTGDVDVRAGADVGTGTEVDVSLRTEADTGFEETPAFELGVGVGTGLEVGQAPAPAAASAGRLDLRQLQFQTQRQFQAQVQRSALDVTTVPAVTGRTAPPVAAVAGFPFDGGDFEFGVSGRREGGVSARRGRPLDIDIISANLAEFETGRATLPGEREVSEFRRRRSVAGPVTRLRAQEVTSGEAVRPETFDTGKLDDLV